MDTSLVLENLLFTAGFCFFAPRRGCGAGWARSGDSGPAAQPLFPFYLLLTIRSQGGVELPAKRLASGGCDGLGGDGDVVLVPI